MYRYIYRYRYRYRYRYSYSHIYVHAYVLVFSLCLSPSRILARTFGRATPTASTINSRQLAKQTVAGHKILQHTQNIYSYVTACCSMLQRVAVCCCVLQCVAACPHTQNTCLHVVYAIHSHVAVCCSVLQCVTACPHTRHNLITSVFFFVRLSEEGGMGGGRGGREERGCDAIAYHHDEK